MGYKIDYAKAEVGERAYTVRFGKGRSYLSPLKPFKGGEQCYRFTRFYTLPSGKSTTSTTTFRNIGKAWQWGGVIAGETP